MAVAASCPHPNTFEIGDPEWDYPFSGYLSTQENYVTTLTKQKAQTSAYLLSVVNY